MNLKNLSIVIPAYNEASRIGKTLKQVSDYLENKPYPSEIIVVDDGSSDDTAALVRQFQKEHPTVVLLVNKRNRGKGYSVRRGMLAAQSDYILFSDADLSTPIHTMDTFERLAERSPIVIGSRRLSSSIITVRQPWYRRIPGNVFPLLVNLLVLQGVRDTQCGFKLFRKDVARALFSKQKLTGFGFDVEILSLAKKKRIPIKEVPVIWTNDLESKLNPLRDSYRMLKELLRIKLNDLRGRY